MLNNARTNLSLCDQIGPETKGSKIGLREKLHFVQDCLGASLFVGVCLIKLYSNQRILCVHRHLWCVHRFIIMHTIANRPIINRAASSE